MTTFRYFFGSRRAMFWQLVLGGLLLGLARRARADCECGYSAVVDGNVHVFTDLIETDFAQLDDDDALAANTDWARQAFNVTADKARGRYGEAFQAGNMRTAASTKSEADYDGQPAAGLELVVDATLVDGMVPVAEIDSTRDDIFFGTFRASIKLTDVPGTCSAFFWYFNDTQEIDMEFLSREFNASNSTFPVNLVLQSREAAESGFRAQGTPTFATVNLPFDPTADLHEYRIDFLPGTVVFYADNQVLARMDSDDAVPSHAGHLVLQQWSNGNPLWSGGPPAQTAVTTVAYVKAYFNSSATQRQTDWARRCADPLAPGAVCAIPELTATNTTPAGWFFSGHGNMTNNQTVSGQDSSSGGARLMVAAAAGGGLWPAVVVAVLLGSSTFFFL